MNLYVANLLNKETGEIGAFVIRGYDELKDFILNYDFETFKLMVIEVDDFQEYNEQAPDYPPDN